MDERAKKLAEEARRLSPADRAKLVEDILERLDPNLDQLWSMEAKDRLAAFREAEMDAIDFEEAPQHWRSRTRAS